MNFNSLEFLVFFPAVFALYWALPHRLRWVLLLAASWLFYFWWNPWTGFLLVGTTLVSWLCAKRIARTEKAAARRAWLALVLAACLGCLSIFKYTGFFASIAGLELPLQIILPVGISFYTFQTLSYVIDVYRGTVKPERHFGYYALFVSFFPQLVAGPIERPENLLPQLRAKRLFSTENLAAGGWLLLEGYFKKNRHRRQSRPLRGPGIRCARGGAGAGGRAGHGAVRRPDLLRLLRLLRHRPGGG